MNCAPTFRFSPATKNTRLIRMKVLLIADIIGKPGRRLLEMYLPSLIQTEDLDFVVANAENAAHGFGVTPDVADELLRIGVDVLTSGNHIWDKKEIIE